MILDRLHYWVEQMHVDGFRFDLAAILECDDSGKLMPNPPVLWDSKSDPTLAGTKLIAEAWDAAGLYKVGSFLGDSWKEWNGRFRDDVRSFFRGDEGFDESRRRSDTCRYLPAVSVGIAPKPGFSSPHLDTGLCR